MDGAWSAAGGMGLIDLKALMDSAFQFRIGEMVAPKAVLAAYRVELETCGTVDVSYGHRLAVPHPDVVLERWLQECHGGVQKTYRIRRGGSTEQVTEFELSSYSEIIDHMHKAVAKPVVK